MEFCTARVQQVYLCGLGFAKGYSWGGSRSVSLASGPRPPACTPAPVPLSLLSEWCLRRQSHSRSLAVERLPPASGTNPPTLKGLRGRVFAAPSLSLFSPSAQGPTAGCPAPLLPPGPPALSHCSPACGSWLPAKTAVLSEYSPCSGPSQTPDVLSCGPCSLLLAFTVGMTLSESTLFVPAALTCKLGHLLTPGPPHLAENYPAVFTFPCAFTFLYAHTRSHTLFPWG